MESLICSFYLSVAGTLSNQQTNKQAIPVATLPGAWSYWVSGRTGKEIAAIICNLCLGVAARKTEEIPDVCLLVACHPSNMVVYLRDGSVRAILRAAALQIKLSTSPSHSILTPGRPVPALTLYRQAPCRVATGVPILKSLV